MDSSVGLCAMHAYGTTVGVALGHVPDVGFNDERVKIFRGMVYIRYRQLLEGNLVSDPLNVFVKQEPHKASKLREGRLRLISAVSMVDTMLDRIIFGPLVERVDLTVARTPCLVGWTPVKGGYHLLNSVFRRRKVLAVDKSAWDWTVRPWVVGAWADFINGLAVHPPDWWRDLVSARFTMLFRHARFQFPDGSFANQPGWGIMKSGCLLTLILNSVGQSLAHYVAMRRMDYPAHHCEPFCFGDDTVQLLDFDMDEYIYHLGLLGMLSKIETIGEDFDFVGWKFSERSVVPAYENKHKFNILYGDFSTKMQMLNSLQYLYVYNPSMLKVIQQNLVVASASSVRSRAELVAFMEGC